MNDFQIRLRKEKLRCDNRILQSHREDIYKSALIESDCDVIITYHSHKENGITESALVGSGFDCDIAYRTSHCAISR